MRHNKAVNHLGRKSGHRKALLSNMATSLIMHKRINTTVAKAKALKSYASVTSSQRRQSPSFSVPSHPRLQTVREDTPACSTPVSVRATQPRWR